MSSFRNKVKPIEKPGPARAYALRLLSRRGYSVGEMEERLLRRQVPPAVRAEVLSALIQKGLLDDGVYAEAVARSRMERGWGPRKVSGALRIKRLDRETIEKALREVFPAGRSAERARKVLDGHAARFCRVRKNSPPGKEREKALRFLIQRGYSLPEARDAVRGFFSYNPDSYEDCD